MFSVCLRWILRNVCATLFLGIKKALTLRKCLIYLVPGGEVESPHTFVRWILSPVRLPIPPPRQRKNEIITNTGIYANY